MYLTFGSSHKYLAAAKTLFKSCSSDVYRGISVLGQRPSFNIPLPVPLDLEASSKADTLNHSYVKYVCKGTAIVPMLPAVKSSKISTILFVSSDWNCRQIRHFRSGRDNPSSSQQSDQNVSHKDLIGFPWIIVPRYLGRVYNFYFDVFYMRPYLDKEFNMASFHKGVLQAKALVSREFSRGNFKQLEGLVTRPCLEEIQTKYIQLSPVERNELAVVAEDFIVGRTCEIQVIRTNEGTKTEQIFVQISISSMFVKGYGAAMMGKDPREISKVKKFDVLYYRFIREYTKGVNGSWTVNAIYHGKENIL